MLFTFSFAPDRDVIMAHANRREEPHGRKRDACGLTGEEAIARYRSRNNPKPALTADIVIPARSQNKPQVLLMEQGGHPYIGKLALPGGFANENEPVEETAARELAEETGSEGIAMELVGVFSCPGRDPRGRVVSAAFAAVVNAEALTVQAGNDAAGALWYSIESSDSGLVLRNGTHIVPAEDLAFDHAEVLACSLAPSEPINQGALCSHRNAGRLSV